VKVEIEIPDKYAQKLEEVEAAEPTVQDQIEIEVLPQVLRLINDAHRQLKQQSDGRLVSDPEE
jgi:flagellar biosynthesis/type III secretory pathway protein FliH